MRDMSIIISGNPADGFTYHGPFDDDEQAMEWAERNCDGDWWLGMVTPVTVGDRT